MPRVAVATKTSEHRFNEHFGDTVMSYIVEQYRGYEITVHQPDRNGPWRAIIQEIEATSSITTDFFNWPSDALTHAMRIIDDNVARGW